MTNEKYRNSIISAYRNLIDNAMANMSSEERAIIECPNIGTVRDGGKAIYAAELRNLLSILLTTYYSTENLDKWNELKLKLENMLKDELNYEIEGKHTTEIISKNWATNAFLKYMSYAESELTPDGEAESIYSESEDDTFIDGAGEKINWIYEVSSEIPEIMGSGSTFTRVVRTKDKSEAFSLLKDGRNRLERFGKVDGVFVNNVYNEFSGEWN